MSEEIVEGNAETDLSDKVIRLVKKSARLKWIYLLFLVFLILTLVGGVYGLGQAHKLTQAMNINDEDNPMGAMLVKLSVTQTDVEAQYKYYTDMIGDESVLSLSDSFTLIYTQSLSSEQDYVELMTVYNQLSFDSASRVRGSGEWYFYYKKDLVKGLEQAKKQQARMDSYFKDKNST